MKKEVIIIAAVAVVALLVVMKLRKSKEGEEEAKTGTSGQATGDEGAPAVEPANKLKVIKANFVANTAQMDGISVQPTTTKGNGNIL